MKGGLGHDHLDGDGGNNLLDPDSGNDDMANGIQVDLDSEFKAILTGSGNMSGCAQHSVENEGGQVKTTFELQVNHLAANATLDVTLDGVMIGQINTDGSGQGELQLSSDPSGNELAFPSNFPSIHAGSTLVVAGGLQGTFAVQFGD